jgi:hypothetical protein
VTTNVESTQPIESATCFACGRGYCKGDGRFCSSRCREAFDGCLPPASDSNYARAMINVPQAAWRIIAGPRGIKIGARLYEHQKGDGWTIPRPIKKRRKFIRKINGPQARSATCSVP